MHFEFGAYNDNGTAGIVNTLTEKVLTEATLLTFKHIGKRFKRAVAGACYRAASSAVIDKGVNSLLKHSLFVSYDNIGCAELKEPFKAVISVYNSSVKIVKIRGGKSAAVKLNHGADIRRNYRNNIHNHPFKLIAALIESINNIKPFKNTHSLLARCRFKLCGKLVAKLLNINILKQLFNGFRAHAGFKIILISFAHFGILFFVENLHFLKRSIAGIGYDIKREIKHFFKIAGAYVKHKAEAAGNSLEIPNVGNGSCKLNMTHTLAANL